MDRTLVICKPDAVERGLVGEIIGRLERKGLQIVAAKVLVVDRRTRRGALRRAPRAGLSSRILVSFITGRRFSRWLSKDRARPGRSFGQVMGATDPAEAPPGTIRGDLATSMPDNLIHGSDSPEAAAAGDRSLLPRTARHRVR